MPQRKLIQLHIGTHKTGTTSFQVVLEENRERLREHGTYVHISPNKPPGKPIANCTDFSHAILRNELKTPFRLSGNPRPAGYLATLREQQKLRKGLSDSGCPNGIVSSEALCFARTAAELRRLRLLLSPYRVRVIVVLRDEARWRQSWEAQLMKTAEQRGVAEQTFAPLLESWYFDRERIVRFWSSFGDPVLIDYDREIAENGSILPALFDATGVRDIAMPTDVRMNSTPTAAP